MGFYLLLRGYVHSPIRDFESYFRILTGLDEDDIQLRIKQNNSKFTKCIIPPGVYTFRDLSGNLSRSFENEFEIRGRMRPVIIDSDNVSLMTKLRLVPQIMVLRFDKKSFLNTILGFTPYWDYKHFGNEYYSEKNRNLSKFNEILSKCDCIDGSVIKGVKQPILYSFTLDKPSGNEVFSQPETVHYKKMKKSVSNTITFYLEDDNKIEVNFNGETLSFTLQMIKV